MATLSTAVHLLPSQAYRRRRLLTLSKDLIHQNQMNLMAYLLKMLKPIAETIAPSLTHLFNIFITKGAYIIVLWKDARIVPIPKSAANKSCPSGYRFIYPFCPS